MNQSPDMLYYQVDVRALSSEGAYAMGKDLKGKELGVGICQRDDERYVGRFTTRRGVRKQKTFLKLQECRQWLADSQYNDEHSNLNFSENMTVKTWFDFWISMKKRTVRPNTVRNYTERYNLNIDPVIGKKLLKDVSTIHCQMIMNKMADKGYRTSTICQARITLYSMLDYALHNDVITKNPCNGIVKSDIGKASRKREALSIAQQKLFVNGINSNSYEIQYRFLLQTGLRTGELVGLKWEDIDFEKRNLTVSRSMEFRHSVGEWKVGPPKSKLSYRTIPLTDEAVELLKMQKSKNADIHIIPIEWSEFVFLCRKGTPVKNSTYDTMLFKLCDKIGIPKFSMHILRHTFATRCIEAGMKPKTLQMILGHANIGITMNLYVHTTEDEKLKEINMVADSLKVV